MNYKKYIGAILTGSMLFVSCDSYLDIEPKGRTQLTTTADYLGLLEDCRRHTTMPTAGICVTRHHGIE